MASAENTYALTSLERVRMHLGPEGRTQGADVELALIINAVSATMERFCGRSFRSRTWTHDGTTLPRLTSTGGTKLWLRNAPVTAVSSLKLYPGSTALTEGWDQDFVVHHEAGIVELVGGGVFLDAPGVVEITYTGGFLSAPTAAQEAEWGWSTAAADVELACIQQVAWVYRGKDRVKEGVASRSFEGVTTAYLTDELLPEVQKKLERWRRVSEVWL